MKKILILQISLLLTGCVTIQGPSLGLPSIDKISSFEDVQAGISDTLSQQVRETRSLIKEGKLNEAYELFRNEEYYFRKRYITEKKTIPSEFKLIADYAWRKKFENDIKSANDDLVKIQDILDRSMWENYSKKIQNSKTKLSNIDSDLIFTLYGVGQAEVKSLEGEVDRLEKLIAYQRASALKLTFEELINSGQVKSDYIDGKKFQINEYVNSNSFQKLVLSKILAEKELIKLENLAKRFQIYLSQSTMSLIDDEYNDRVRSILMADGRISLEELSQLNKFKAPFGDGSNPLKRLVKIGYLDLTTASFKNRNIFDFEVGFNKDIDVDYETASEAVFNDADLSKFDYLFVTDLSVAKINRESKGKKGLQSTIQTGVRQVQNPEYITALGNYQKALSELQRANIQQSRPQQCQGYGCAVIAFANSLAVTNARNQVDRFTNILAQTSQTKDIPVYSNYTYQSVSLMTTKSAVVDYYIIDLKKRQIYKNDFKVSTQEKFNVAYNVQENDQNKYTIYSNLKKEEDVVSWEKRQITISIGSLFNQENLKTSKKTSYKSAESFLRSVGSKQYASAGPTYSARKKNKESIVDNSLNNSNENGSIADARFDSIVIIRTPKGLGTGFYVTPDLILTAYHVVNDSSLVETVYYDGTKSFGRVVDHDIRLDLALIKAQQVGKPLKIFKGPIRLGETVEAIGHPRGYEFTITRGVLSAIRRQKSLTIDSGNLVEFVQTDTPISPGNSGGPLLISDLVVGVNDWIRLDQGSQNLNFSVSYNEIRAYLNRFLGK